MQNITKIFHKSKTVEKTESRVKSSEFDVIYFMKILWAAMDLKRLETFHLVFYVNGINRLNVYKKHKFEETNIIFFIKISRIFSK